MALDVLASSA